MSLAMPDIDVVIPVGPVDDFLAAAIASVREQNVGRHQIWLVDDAADCAPRESLTQHTAEDVTVLPNSRGRGIGGARNTGVAAGTAPLLAFLDSDDLWPPDRSQRLIKALGGGPAIVYGAVSQFTDSGVLDGDLDPVAIPGTTLMSREVWQTVGDFDESLRLGEVIDWMSRSRRQGVQTVEVPGVTLLRRVHGANTTLDRIDERQAYLEVVRRHLGRQG